MENLKKKQTGLSSNVVPVGLDFLVAEGKAAVAMQVIDFLWKLDSGYQKTNKFQLRSGTSMSKFLSC